LQTKKKKKSVIEEGIEWPDIQDLFVNSVVVKVSNYILKVRDVFLQGAAKSRDRWHRDSTELLLAN
jgi:hypothetical protein